MGELACGCCYIYESKSVQCDACKRILAHNARLFKRKDNYGDIRRVCKDCKKEKYLIWQWSI